MEGVGTDPSKIKAVQEWLEPQNMKELRNFLGLSNYYMKFVKGYTSISKPLTMLLRKWGFQWNEEAAKAFPALKNALGATPILQF